MTSELVVWITILSGLANVAIAAAVIMGRSWAKKDAVAAVVDALRKNFNELNTQISTMDATQEERHKHMDEDVKVIRKDMKQEHERINRSITDLDRRVSTIEGRSRKQ